MEKDKNLAEEAFIQMKNVEDIIAENAKGILASTMKEEINQLVKESLSEQEDEIETDTEDEMEMDSDDEMEMDFEDEMESDLTPIDLTGASDEEVLKVFKSMSDEDGIIVKKEDEGIYLTDDDTYPCMYIKNDGQEDSTCFHIDNIGKIKIPGGIDNINSSDPYTNYLMKRSTNLQNYSDVDSLFNHYKTLKDESNKDLRTIIIKLLSEFMDRKEVEKI